MDEKEIRKLDLYQKAVDRQIDLFKHITTLNTAAPILIFAVYQRLDVPNNTFVPALAILLLFVVSLLFGLYGLIGLARELDPVGNKETLPEYEVPYTSTLLGAYITFFLGVFTASAGAFVSVNFGP